MGGGRGFDGEDGGGRGFDGEVGGGKSFEKKISVKKVNGELSCGVVSNKLFVVRLM